MTGKLIRIRRHRMIFTAFLEGGKWVASRISGIVVEIGGDTTGLEKALSGVNKEISTTQKDLKDVERLLKLDPTNTELLKQKQELLAKAVEGTEGKLKSLKEANAQAAESVKKYDDWKAAYDPIKSEIDQTNKKLKELKEAQKEALDVHGADSEEYKNLQTEVSNTSKELRELKERAKDVNEEFGNPISKEQYDSLQREIAETEAALKSLEEHASKSNAVLSQISGVTGGISDKAEMLADKTKPLSGAAVGIGTIAIKMAADFDSGMSQVAAISGATQEELEMLRNKAKEMGAATKFSASEAAEAMNYMAMAGWKAEEMEAGIAGIMNLAAASGEDLATTSDIVTDALTAFGMKAEDSGHFADVLAKASASANTNVGMMGETFKYVAPVAGAMGYSAEDVAVAVGLMANSGIKASQAGTALRAALTNMVSPSETVAEKMGSLGFYATETQTVFDQQKIDAQMIKVEKASLAAEKAQKKYNDAVKKYGEDSSQAVEAMTSLGIKNQELALAKEKLSVLQAGETSDLYLYNQALQNEDGTMKTLDETMDFLRETFSGMSEAEQTAAASAIFGKEAMSGMLAIINTSEEDYNKLSDSIANSKDAAQEMAEMMQDNLSGQVEELMGGMETLAITLGEALIPFVSEVVGWLQKGADWLNTLDEDQIQMIATILLVIAAISPLISTFAKLFDGISFISGTAIPKLISAFQFLMAHPIVLLIAGIIALVALIATKGDEIQGYLQKLDDWLQGIFTKDWTEIFGPGLGNGLNTFFANVKNFWDAAKEIFDGIIDFIRGIFTGDWERAWEGVKEIFSGIFDGFEAIAKTPINGVIGIINGAIGGINSLIKGANKIPGIDIPTIGTIPYLANGGILSSGSAVVGEAGPELLTMMGNQAMVTPLTQSTTTHNAYMGGITMNIYGAPGQDVDELADIISEKIDASVQRDKAVFA